jgi:hypothetical protein
MEISVKQPSMPKPEIAAWKTSALWSRLHRSVPAPGVSSTKDSTCSPNDPTAKLFLPWMFIAAAPPTETALVPGTTGGQKP